MSSVSSEFGSHKPEFLSAWNTNTTSIGTLDDDHNAIANMASNNRNGATGIEQISASQRMLSATWGSLLTSLLVTPLDVVRVRLQSQSSFINNTSRFNAHTAQTFKALPADLGVTACCREVFWVGENAEVCLVGQAPSGGARGSAALVDCAVEETRQRTFTSTLDGLQKIARNEGPLTLWRGLSPTLVMAIPANVIYFSSYDWLRFDRRSPIRRYFGDTAAPLIAGSVARIAAASVISPIEMFKTRLQATSGTGSGHFRETLRGLHQMTQSQGYSSLWRGLTLTMWRDVPFSGLYWWGYETLRSSLAEIREIYTYDISRSELQKQDRRTFRSQQNSTTLFMDSFVAGCLSGAVSALVTTPFDVGKTRQQVFRHRGDEAVAVALAGSSKVPATGVRPEEMAMPRFLYHIFREEGFSGLFRGWAARCLKVAPACAIMISSYEIGKRLAQGVNERRNSSLEADGDGA